MVEEKKKKKKETDCNTEQTLSAKNMLWIFV